MFSEFFIRRPRFAAVISLALIIAGGICAFRLPVRQYPEKSGQAIPELTHKPSCRQ